MFLFESDLGWNGLGVLEDVIDYVELYKLEKVSICFSNGDYEFVDKSQLKSLKWELEEKHQEIEETVKSEYPVAGIQKKSKEVNSVELDHRKDLVYIKGSDSAYTGIQVSFYENDKSGLKLMERNFMNGKKDGVWTQWWDNGLKWSISTYKDGKADGLFVEWHPNGQKENEINYKDA